MPVSDKEVKEASKKMGEIRIVFFKAHEVWKKFRVNSLTSQKPQISNAYKTVPAADSKLCQTRSLSVTVGRQFQMPIPSSALFEADERGQVRSTIGDFDMAVDQIVLRYSNAATLIGLGLISPFNQGHWKFLPKDFLMHNDIILSIIIKSIQRQEPQAKNDMIASIFEKTVGFDCNDVCKGGLKGFLENLKNKSEITRESLV